MRFSLQTLKLIGRVLGRRNLDRTTARNAYLMFGIVLPVLVCSMGKCPNQVPSETSIDPIAARKLSDALAEDLLKLEKRKIWEKGERPFRDAVDDQQFAAMLNQMFRTYGTPLEFDFKQGELGTKSYADGQIKPIWKFWYAARTTKHEKGSHFLIVEVVKDDPDLAFASFAIVSFDKEVPANLR